MSREEKREKQAQATMYNYERARKDYVSMMEDLSLNQENDDEVFFVNNTVYEDMPKKKPKKKARSNIILLDSDDDDDDDEEKECIAYENYTILEGHPDLKKEGPHYLWDIEDLVLLGRQVNGKFRNKTRFHLLNDNI
jgi:hypothetical protein